MNNTVRILFSILLFSIGIPSISIGQQVVYEGAVLDDQDSKRIAAAEIINLKSKESIYSNTMGTFKIKGNLGDTLLISKQDYTESKVVLQKETIILIKLKHSLLLQDVNVYSQSKKDQLDEIMDGYRKKGNYYNGKPPPLAYVLSPISALYGLLGKTPKDARRFQNYMNTEIEQSTIDRKFTIHLVEDCTGLTGEDLKNFMSIHRPSFNEAENWNEYSARTYIKKAFEAFEANGRPAAQKLPKIPIPKQER